VLFTLEGKGCINYRREVKEPTSNNLGFNQVALEHLDALYGFAMSLTRNQTEAEDLVQETYLRAVRAFGQLMPDSNLKSWMFAIMRNLRLNQLRHARVGPDFIELDSEEENNGYKDETTRNPYEVYVSKLERQEVRAAIESLPLVYREVVLLRDIEGFSYQEIATILECPAGTVMSRLGRAREKLRMRLGQWQAQIV
jgi:RNA polymerase sigma-70 factor, ECF subfamily